MYAIIETGSKQYRVQEGDVINVELLDETSNAIRFDKVLFWNDGKQAHVGVPYIANCLVQGEYVQEVKAPKVLAFKYKKCKNYRRIVGHRQKYSQVKITKVGAA
jgi:large subunit ribosomal protein L21